MTVTLVVLNARQIHFLSVFEKELSYLGERVYVWVNGEENASESCKLASLQHLALIYEAVSRSSPQLDVVPLLPCVGWSRERVSQLPDVEQMLWLPPKEADKAESFLSLANSLRSQQGLAALRLVAPAEGSLEPDKTAHMPHPRPVIEGLGPLPGKLEYSHAAVGGTFDSLHAGHRLLLSAAAAVTRGTLWLGIASDALLANKGNADLLQRYAEREANAVEFLRRVRPGMDVRPGPLTDPSEPPLAATMREMEALVVSRETTGGAEWINGHRRTRGFGPLDVLVVGLVGADGQDAGSAKLSSSGLRAKRAASSGG
eukprot:CAMPEP_0177580374 /NCGR_PEP_ID=MMETSP0419_2-20121207/1521_1 /TAXON_ID=582737 /ORGANISM="Tetraselmis sp., Strain GSL018" /LENGTH=314 /DNA_ID=CAMNT_0019069227 /DNA_START=257 /DNA_END=1201 /DNA_ORIENTATION=-